MTQRKWLEKAKDTYNFHRSNLLSHDKWTITQTAKLLRRSLGSISEDLIIARWCKIESHQLQLEQFEHTCDALKFIRKEQKKQGLDEIE